MNPIHVNKAIKKTRHKYFGSYQENGKVYDVYMHVECLKRLSIGFYPNVVFIEGPDKDDDVRIMPLQFAKIYIQNNSKMANLYKFAMELFPQFPKDKYVEP